jgi:hypothetical protein
MSDLTTTAATITWRAEHSSQQPISAKNITKLYREWMLTMKFATTSGWFAVAHQPYRRFNSF